MTASVAMQPAECTTYASTRTAALIPAPPITAWTPLSTEETQPRGRRLNVDFLRRADRATQRSNDMESPRRSTHESAS